MSVKKALVVDDSKLARITLKKKLELRAVDVDMVESATEALSYLQSHQPDIIFMDHLMPEIDGFEATKRIKANPATRHIPVIMCTGKEHEGYLQEATAIGAANILSKPPETDALNAILDMDLVPAVAQSRTETVTETVAAAPVFVEPPILQPISMPVAPVAVAAPLVSDRAGDDERIDDSFDADAAFGVEAESSLADDFIDTSELESLSSLPAADDTATNDEAMLLGLDGIDGLDQESALASLDALAGDELLSDALADDVTAAALLVDDPTDVESIADESIAEEVPVDASLTELAALESTIEATAANAAVADDNVFDASEFEQAAIEETAFAEPDLIEPEIVAPVTDEQRVDEQRVDEQRVDEQRVDEQRVMEQRIAEPRFAEPAIAAASTTAPIVAHEEVLSLISTEFARRATSMRETIIADLTGTIRRQLDDMRNAVGENSELHETRLRALESSASDLAATSASKSWVLEKLPPALDMARLTDDIAARIAIVQNPDVLPSDDLVSVRARLDEVESELVTLRKREAPVIDSSALQSLLPGLSRQLDTLLQQRIPVIVSDISDQVQLQLAYQMNDGRAPAAAAASTPSLDKIITTQADIETQINALKKQLNDEWNARLQALVKQLKDQLQHAPLPTSVDTSALREQCRNDARDDLKRALTEFKAHINPGAPVHTDAPSTDAHHFEQMLETVTNQFARTHADYEQKLKQSRMIAIGAVVASVVISAALAIFL